MTALRIFNVVMLLLTGTLFMVFGVVCLMYGYHLSTSPRMQAEWPMLARTTVLFGVLAAACALAFWAQHRRLAWRWPAQLVQVLTLVAGSLLLSRMLQ